ncbi:MAG: serine/threonine-protein kinase, partial [Planctomycetaceae bacterium]
MTDRVPLTPEQLREIDVICDQFEADARAGQQPSIDEYLPRVDEPIRDHLRKELQVLQRETSQHGDETPAEGGDNRQTVGPSMIVFNAQARSCAEGEVQFRGFELLEEIAPGVGGMGMVFKAREESLDRIVALKCAKSHLRDSDGREFFTQEARHAASLDHPQIVGVYNFVADHDPPYYVMQFVDGVPLDRACEGRDPAYVAALLEQAADVLAFAHDHGVIHRDIKPSNILVDPTGWARGWDVNARSQGRIYIADFGLAARWDGDSPMHSPDAPVLGTMHYIPPEVYSGIGRICPAIDVYALGVTMYRLLTGKHPFVGATVAELQDAVLHETVALLKDVNPSVPEPLQRICLKAMERDPEQRYESAHQLTDDLRRFSDGREVLARPTRYKTELQGLLQNHSTEIRGWQEKNLIRVPDMDRLLFPYRMLMTSDSPWRALSRSFPWETVLMRVGGWFILLSSILWLVFYWQDLTRFERILSVSFPAIVLNSIGWLLHFLRSKWNARIFLSTGALLLPLLTDVLFTEYEFAAARYSLEDRQRFEVFDYRLKTGVGRFRRSW